MNGYEAIKFSRETGRRVRVMGNYEWICYKGEDAPLIDVKDLFDSWEVEPELIEGWMILPKSHAFGNLAVYARIYRTKDIANVNCTRDEITIRFREVRD